MRRTFFLSFALLLSPLACVPDGRDTSDARVTDAKDAAPDDAGEDERDTGARDTGLRDAGADAEAIDVGADTGERDAAPDAGEDDDAGEEADAAEAGADAGVDAGQDGGAEDAGAPDAEDAAEDANVPDAAEDASTPDAEDAAQDAGTADAAGDAGTADAAGDAGTADAAQDAGPADAAALPSSYASATIDGTFRHGQTAVIVDIDADGDLDVISSKSLTDTVRLYLNGGNSSGGGNGSTFSTVQIATNGSIVAMHAAAADLDGDGDLDIAAVGLFDRSCEFCSPGRVMWYANPGNASGTWTANTITASMFGPRYIAAADLTGDGRPDLVVGAIDVNGQGNGVHWFRNTGGAFTSAMALDASLMNVHVNLVTDVDGDGVLDVIASAEGGVRWYENLRPAGTVQNTPNFSGFDLAQVGAPNGIALIENDGDARPELAVAHNDGGGAILLFDAPANPRSPWSSTPIDAAFGGGTNLVRIANLDVNADGRPDLAVASNLAAELRVYVNDPIQGFVAQTVSVGLTGLMFVAGGDLSRDGRADMVTTTYEGSPSADTLLWWRTVP